MIKVGDMVRTTKNLKGRVLDNPMLPGEIPVEEICTVLEFNASKMALKWEYPLKENEEMVYDHVLVRKGDYVIYRGSVDFTAIRPTTKIERGIYALKKSFLDQPHLTKGTLSLKQIDQIKENFKNTYQNRKGFAGVERYDDISVLRCYVKDFDHQFVKEVRKNGSAFEGVPVVFVEK